MEDELTSVTDHARRYMLAAVRAFGTDVLSPHPATSPGQPESVGCELFRLILGEPTQRDKLDRQLVALARDPDDQAAWDVIEGLARDAIDDDPAVAEIMLAISPGGHQALIGIAYLYRLAGDDGAARACLDQAMMVGDPTLTARALWTLAGVLERSDPQAAESALLQAIETGHEDWAPAAMYGLGGRRKGRGDDQGARAAYQLAIDTGHHEWACAARYQLAEMLEEQGDQAGAREQYSRLAEIGHEHWGQDAVDHLIPQLQQHDDVQGLRVLHRIAVEKNYWTAPEALVAIGDVLEKRGDHDGARAAYQQAIDDGYHYADDLIERL